MNCYVAAELKLVSNWFPPGLRLKTPEITRFSTDLKAVTRSEIHAVLRPIPLVRTAEPAGIHV